MNETDHRARCRGAVPMKSCETHGRCGLCLKCGRRVWAD